jgi:hypothetical protein
MVACRWPEGDSGFKVSQELRNSLPSLIRRDGIESPAEQAEHKQALPERVDAILDPAPAQHSGWARSRLDTGRLHECDCPLHAVRRPGPRRSAAADSAIPAARLRGRRAKARFPSRHRCRTLRADKWRMSGEETLRRVPPGFGKDGLRKAADSCRRNSCGFERRALTQSRRWPALAQECAVRSRRGSCAAARRAGSGTFQTCCGQHEPSTPRSRSPHRPGQYIENLRNSEVGTASSAATGAQLSLRAVHRIPLLRGWGVMPAGMRQVADICRRQCIRETSK